MKNIKKALFISIPLGAFFLLTVPAHAYFYQAPQPTYYIPVPRYHYYDQVSAITQSHLNFVDRFTYIPAPIRPYFYTYYSPFSFWGW